MGIKTNLWVKKRTINGDRLISFNDVQLEVPDGLEYDISGNGRILSYENLQDGDYIKATYDGYTAIFPDEAPK